MSNNFTKKVEVINKAITFITEFLDSANVCVFVNWVEDGETLRAEVLHGNQFALKGHIEKWACENLDEVKDGYQEDHQDN
jgi:hypothetical protein